MNGPVYTLKPVVVTGDVFSRRIIGRHTRFGSSLRYFSPLVSTGGVIRLLGRWIDLIYAMPFASVTRETTIKSIKSTADKIDQVINLILNFPFNLIKQENIFQGRKSFEIRLFNNQAVSSQMPYLFRADAPTSRFSLTGTINRLQGKTEKPGINREYMKPAIYPQSVSEETDQIVTEHSGDTERLVTRRSEIMSENENRLELPASVIARLQTVRRNPLLLVHQMPAIFNTAGGLIASPAVTNSTTSLIAPNLRKENEKAQTLEYGSPVVDGNGFIDGMRERPPASGPSTTRRMAPVLKETAGGSRLNVLNVTRIEPVYRSSPAMEITGSKGSPQMIRERVIEKEPAPVPVQPPKIDMERLTDEVYRLFERKVRIERERRGL